MQMDWQPCMFEVIKGYRETDKNGDGKTDMQRNGQTRTRRRDRYAHSGQGPTKTYYGTGWQ